jgi:hypothetical protein
MSSATEQRAYVRQRAKFACEYCGVTETDVGGELTVDHIQPHAKGGTDDLDNLVYCCVRCNQYKGDYWPDVPTAPSLWNPRTDEAARHMVRLGDGTVHGRTATGRFTIQRLRLNRPPLVAARKRKHSQEEEARLLTQYRDTIALLERVSAQQAALLTEQRRLLEAYQALLAALLDDDV